MYKIFTIIIAATLIIGLQPYQGIAQAPEKFNYQAVVYKSNGQLLKNRPVGLRFSILQGSAVGPEVYIETQNVMTNNNGMVDAQIGDGSVVLGTFSAIMWSSGIYFIKTETDPNGGTNYTITGTSQLLSVPYALFAKESGSSTPGPEGPQGPQGPAGTDVPAGVSTGNVVMYDVSGNNWVARNLATLISGGSQPFSIMQPYLALNYCIALQHLVVMPNVAVSYCQLLKTPLCFPCLALCMEEMAKLPLLCPI